MQAESVRRALIQQGRKQLDLRQLTQEIGERYFRYLKTTFYFKDPDFRKSFEAALDKGSLVKGPFIEATPVYKRGQKAGDLVREILKEFEPEPAFLATLSPSRQLYSHQEQAIRRVNEGRNVVVATGTGSGKTESYLYPILLHLYRASLAREKRVGVKALVLYPMNALANDQRRRLGEYRKQLHDAGSSFSFSFGQYTGETPEDEGDLWRYAKQHAKNRLPGELIFRSEMRATPPDVLLTNYSMLEYLLLRPDDTPLFDDGRGETWHFLVLDEVHQYRGSKGMEMAMLIRRLKRRLRDGGCATSLQCIATSASLGHGTDDRRRVAQFATKLFGEDFSDEDVILEDREDAQAASPLNEQQRYDWYLSALQGNDTDESTKRFQLLQSDARVDRLRKALQVPQRADDLADRIFDDAPSERRPALLSALVELLAKTFDSQSGAPLMSPRYHFFLRSLEGAFVSYYPRKCVSLERGSGDASIAFFEVALCRECGQHYFVGRRESGKLLEAIRDPSNDDFNVSFFRPADDEFIDLENESAPQQSRLCLRCRSISSPGTTTLSCSHSESISVFEERVRDEHEDQMRTCGSCGHRGPDPVREVVHGADGPNAVIATTLHCHLPDERRKVLAFADGRQEAAFFAWYAQDTYDSLRDRNVIISALRNLEKHGPVSLRTLAGEVRDQMKTLGVIQASEDEVQAQRRAWTTVFREFVTDEPRLSLQGVGLVRWFPQFPTNLKIPPLLLQPPWSLSEEEAVELMRVLVDSIRAEFAAELKTDKGIKLQWDDLGLQAHQSSVEIGSRDGRTGVKAVKGIRAWDGRKGRRVHYLTRILGTKDDANIAAAQEALRAIWEALRNCGSEHNSDDRFLMRVGDAMRLNPDWWRVSLNRESDNVLRCALCGRSQTFAVHKLCARPGCTGTVREVSQGELDAASNHYRVLYAESMPPHLRAEEHTAQIDKERAREFQVAFEHGEIHLLSCSTTFELGVDLGDLDTIFLRNVPPEPFNYAQRVGRAGRRAGYPGLALTYCRRRPHDLAHFAAPERMLEGRTRPPVLNLTNEKIVLRHIAAVALSMFFRSTGNRRRFDDVASFCGDLAHPTGITDLSAFLKVNREPIEATLREIVPPELHASLGLDDGSWVIAITSPESRLARAEAEVSSDFVEVSRLEREHAAAGEYREAAWAKDRAATIKNEDVISFLSRKAAIPKYGFPVDVVELDLHRLNRASAPSEASRVSLQRDLAIAVAEFAPGSRVVANKKVWTSFGLKKVVGREWDRREYFKCSQHGTFMSWVEGTAAPFKPCCDRAAHEGRGRYIDPIFGFVSERRPPDEPSVRPAKVYTTRPYFSRSVNQSPEKVEIGDVVTLTKASPGYLVVLCEGKKGKGFLICRECGAGLSPSPKKPGSRSHTTHYGRDCSGIAEHRVALGHEFLTDVLRLQFHPKTARVNYGDIWFAYSVAYALLEGTAETLEVPSTDLSVTVRQSELGSDMPEIVVYDNVPGGAGLVARLEDREALRECLEVAHRRVSGICGCAEITSCEGCLRSYTNQFAHARLARGPAKDILADILRRWPMISEA